MSFKKIFLMDSQAPFVKFKAKFILKDLIKLFCFSTGKKVRNFFFFIKKVCLRSPPIHTYMLSNF